MASSPDDTAHWFRDQILTSLATGGRVGDRKRDREVGPTPGPMTITGTDTLPSLFAVTDLAVGSIAAAGTMIARYVAHKTGTPPALTVDRRRASLWFGGTVRPVGWTLPPVWDAIAGDYRTVDGWIRLHTNAPHHRAAALAVLASPPDRDAVTAAVAGWSADALETAIVAAGGCAAALRRVADWRAHPQGHAVNQEPLVAVTVHPAAPHRDHVLDAARPLAGIRVLDLTRILAGPVATRFLAGYGADVVRIDPPEWDEPSLAPEITLGKRCARLDLKDARDQIRFEILLADADILIHGYRADALACLGYDAARRRAINPSLIDITLSAYGWAGPWATRRGFDSLVQMSCGLADAGMHATGRDRPTPLPVQALDHATGYLLAAAALRGLTHRATTGAGFTARCSLARTAKLLIDGSAGYAATFAPMTPERADDVAPAIETSVWGPLHRVAPPLTLDGTPQHWDHPAGPLGQGTAAWAA